MPSVTSIGSSAFAGCVRLSSLDLPDSLASIGSNAFENCTSLLSADMPSVESIEHHAFSGCTSLLSADMPSVESIGGNAFEGCASLSSLDLPESLAFIKIYTFNGCSSLSSVVLPESLKSIGSNAFYGCIMLFDVYNHSTLKLTKGSTDNGYVAYYAENVFVADRECGDGLAWALSDEGLLRISGSGSMPDWTDASQAPWYPHKGAITSVLIAGEASVGSKAFYGYSALAFVDLGSATSVGSKAFSYCAGLESLTVPGGVHSVGTYAFCKCTALETLAVGDGVRKVMASAFSGCKALEGVSLPSSLAYLGANAFHDVAFADQYGNALEPTLKSLRGHDFSRSGKALRMVTGEVTEFSVDGISYSATSSDTVTVTGLEGDVASVPCEVSYGDRTYAVTSIGKGALLRCATLTSADLTNVRTLEFKALGNCTGITEMTFGDCLESIGSYALYGLSFYDGGTKLKATPENLRGHSFSGTGGILYLIS